MENLPPLPHLVVEEPKRSKTAIFAIIVMSVLILAIPFGVYLVSIRTESKSQASSPVVQTPETSLILKNNPTLEGPAIEVRVRSDFDPANMVIAKIHYDPALIKVERVASDSANFNKWVESSIDADQGLITLIAGVPGEGVKTKSEVKEGVLLATIFYQGKDSGQTSITFDNDTVLFRGTDNINILKNKGSLNLSIIPGNLDTTLAEASASSSRQAVFLTPKGGENFSYFKPILLVWNLPGVTQIDSLNLLLNGQSLGPIVESFSNEGSSYTWTPQNSLPLPYITSSSVFQIQLQAHDKTTQIDSLSGPFTLSLKQDISNNLVSSESGVLVNTQDFKVEEISSLLSGFYHDKPVRFDLNSDGVINDLDLWIFKNMLIEKQLIKG